MDNKQDSYRLQTLLDTKQSHKFFKPVKRIEDGEGVSFFLRSKAYRDLMTFILQLNTSMFPKRDKTKQEDVQTWELPADSVACSPTIYHLQGLLERLNDVVDEVPPDTGPRRFGNISFRKWCEILKSRSHELLIEFLPFLRDSNGEEGRDELKAVDELETYFVNSFGSAERLDYGTGHELNFLAFLAGIWKLGGFISSPSGDEERALVTRVFEP